MGGDARSRVAVSSMEEEEDLERRSRDIRDPIDEPRRQYTARSLHAGQPRRLQSDPRVSAPPIPPVVPNSTAPCLSLMSLLIPAGIHDGGHVRAHAHERAVVHTHVG